jgi:hypothetical protein
VPHASPRDKQFLQDILVFLALVAIGVAGRWGQPDWCFTPTAAVGIFAGFYFRHIGTALLVPLAVLGITDLALPSYDSRGVMLAVHVALALAIFFGRALRSPSGPLATAAKLGLCGLAPATLFFLISNWAVWQFQSDYAPTLTGLTACYAAAVPFYRAMLAGDIFYVTILLGCYVASVGYLQRPVLQPADVRRTDS